MNGLKLLKEAIIKAGLKDTDGVLVKAYSLEISRFTYHVRDRDTYMPSFVDKEDLIKVFNAYNGLKKNYKLIDFDDMLYRAYYLFKEREDILQKWQNKYSYFLVDEMQDMNEIQFQLMQMISDRTKNIFCVGDDDQSIYGFRGANPKLMKDFTSVYPDCKTILLNYNYRNPSNLVEAASILISKNENRFSKDIKTSSESGLIEVNEYGSELEEADKISNIIKELKEKGLNYDKMAILYRNHTDAKYVLEKLIDMQIPFYLKEAMPNIYSHFIIADMEAYFQIAIGNSTRARLLTIINHPNRYIHRRSVEVGGNLSGMLRFYKDNPSSYRVVESLSFDLNLVGKMSPLSALNYIKNAMGYDNFLKEEAIKNGTDYRDYNEVFEFFKASIRDCRTIKQAIDKINILRLKIDYENKNKLVDKAGKVGLYTLHSSKGLEFDTVFIIGANDGIIPSNKAETKDDMEEERRLFYVGITRTMKSLYVSYVNKKNRDKSRFLNELNLD